MDDLKLQRWTPDKPKESMTPQRIVIFAGIAVAGLAAATIVAGMMGHPEVKPTPIEAPTAVAADAKAVPAAVAVSSSSPVQPPAAAEPEVVKPVQAKPKAKPAVKKTAAKKVTKKAKPKVAPKKTAKKSPPPLDLDALSKSYKKPSRTH